MKGQSWTHVLLCVGCMRDKLHRASIEHLETRNGPDVRYRRISSSDSLYSAGYQSGCGSRPDIRYILTRNIKQRRVMKGVGEVIFLILISSIYPYGIFFITIIKNKSYIFPLQGHSNRTFKLTFYLVTRILYI